MDLKPSHTLANLPRRGFGDMLHSLVDHPAYQTAQMVPFAGIPLGVAAYGSHMARGMEGHAMLDAVGAIPGAGPARMIPRVLPALTRGSVTANSMRASTMANSAGLAESAYNGL